MKTTTMMVGLAIAAMAATPTLAQSYDDGRHYVAAEVSTTAYAPMAYAPPGTGYQAYAYAPNPELAYGPPPVYSGGSYQGTDPDPFIRQQLQREAPHEFGGE